MTIAGQNGLLTALLATAVAATTACGGDDDGSGGGNGGSGGNGGTTSSTGAGTPGCGTPEAPTPFTLSDLGPPAGASVPQSNVVHTFTTTNAPGVVESVTFLFGAANTAGTPMGMFSFTITDNMNGTYRYDAAPVTWPTAPGHVEFAVQEVFEFPNGCFYAFPNPLFSYDVTDDGGAGGGGGG
jgi:hypothetical protein